MSDQGGFSWEPEGYQARRIRILGAVAILSAGWATGFLSGRMSAWVVPVTTPQTVVIEKVPSRALADARIPERPAPPRNDGRQKTTAVTQELSGAPGLAHRAAEPAAPQPKNAEDRSENTALQTKPAARSVTLINPDAAKAKPSLEPPRPMRETEAKRGDSFEFADLIECERRYASFRRSDGTYQPFDSPSREICPMLRQRGGG